MRGLRTLWRDERGNMMFLTAAAIVPIIGIVGSGVDIGRAYMAEQRLQQACDAGVLAGRRAMSGTEYGETARAEANKMFNFNYPGDAYGSSNVSFVSQAQGASTVRGTASARLPTTLMRVFNYENFDLSVNCAAKLEISNTDVMLVLDVTGSMTTVNSGDSVNRMDALKAATMSFFDTLTNAEMGDGRLRFGVVPYSSTANVGAILMAKNSNWLADTVTLPSRTPLYRTEWGTGTTSNGAASDNYPGSAASGSSWSSWTNQSSSITQANCVIPTQPAGDTPSKSGSQTSTQTSQYVDGNGNRVTNSDLKQNYTYKKYEYRWSSSRCQRRERTYVYTETTPSTLTQPPVQVFDNKYRYEHREFAVSNAKSGGGIVTDTGDAGADRTHYWGGCVIERQTTAFAANQSAPTSAFDMDVDSAPTSNDNTKWRLLIPEIAFPRASGPGSKPSNTSATGSVTVNSSSVSSETGINGSWQNYSRYWSNGWGVCPAPAMKLTTMTKDDRSDFDSYVNSLQAVGGTYHDAGMVWGVRFLSPDGIFADENGAAPNGRPIGRHIIFMTDGEMSANTGNLTFQGYEWTMQRVGGNCTDTVANCDTALTSRHNNRFLQLCEKAKAKNITVWVVSFGVALNTQMTTCATADKAYSASNAAQLNNNFQEIARQISKLRLSQ
ncbi:MAG TPA: TadE/TadG family protein [Sphingopyxis sp.]|nr:TadE/TadG family protein [Sphingopyxis sp.]HMQ18624.1 TadE/TadG family protein [Sphingopyxis sp.]